MNLYPRQSRLGLKSSRGSKVAGAAIALGLLALGSGGFGVVSAEGSSTTSFLSSLGQPTQLASTVPANGDVNPYGIVLVTKSVGKLAKGDFLVSNFNNKANVQGTGSTIVEISQTGHVSTFAVLGSIQSPYTCPGGVGLTTALSILPGGWVVVGSLPSISGGSLPMINPAGCLIVLNPSGAIVATWTNANINGSWDMTEVATTSGADLFVANVLSRAAGVSTTPKSGDQSTIVRIDVVLTPGVTPSMKSATIIGSGFISKPNNAALIQGATGVALGRSGTLYVAETVQNRIAEIPNALTRATPFAGGKKTLSSAGWLNGPLGLAIAPNGDVIAMNGNNGVAVEVSPSGHQVAKLTLVRGGAGDLFGVALASDGRTLIFVNDKTNALDEVTAG